ncbi:glycogen synthase GlgA [Paenibacillus sp. IB182496]|uniref:Glycogen synthase n=1 Tax=Paenibacillus sabuli TaxID=2772509 RepID=A0A927BPS8_9BACL|nr:glycogen synthase GlgA [Paenibacillus sabuli]MBD2843711.1 glycogen synthase GlgA [Paenibacillus sabuli]
MKVLFAAAEGSPFVKTGGLADVIGALPKALIAQGVDARIMLPKYKTIPERYVSAMRFVGHTEVPVGWRSAYCGLFELEHEGVTWYFLDSEYYFGARDGSLYGHYDDGERFAFFNRAVLQLLPLADFQPDLIHAHDWHAGMIAPLLTRHYRHDPFYARIRTIYTIHNLRYQGVFPYSILDELLGLDAGYFHPDRLEFNGGVSFMKGGIVYADCVTTVSRTYADEIRTPYFGEGLDGALRARGYALTGIVNGIDEESYNPAADTCLAHNYRTGLTKKLANKGALQRELGLRRSNKTPLIGMVTRMTAQKGLDLIAHVLHELMAQDDVQLVVLGSGEPHYEGLFGATAQHYADKLAVYIGFDECLARRIYAGSDLFLMPSQFEPCGLSQMIAMRYGSVPIVRETGGLKDTVLAYEEDTGEGNGFTFANYNAHDMLYTIRRAASLYRQPEHWKRIVASAQRGDYSWRESASRYKELYGQVLS